MVDGHVRRTDSDRMIAYQENYDRIAADHLAWWEKTGNNPFQDPDILKSNEDFTVGLINEYAAEGSMIDVGCGMGDLLMRFPSRPRCGIDISSGYLKVARARGLEVTEAAVENIPYLADTFDVVVATDILEHVLDVNAALKEMLRILRPGGTVVARVPDMEPVAWEGQKYEFVHLRIFDEGTLRILFNKIFGCDVLRCVRDQNTIHIVGRKP